MKLTPRIVRLLSLSLLLILLLTSLVPTALADLDKPGRLKTMSGVVQVWWIIETPQGLRGAGAGSGTIISPDGLILTNHHVAVPDVAEVKHLGIALTTRTDRAPQPAYIATVVADDPYLDLSVLRVSHDLNMRPIQTADLNLPFVSLGESDTLDVGDELNIFGYPSIGGDTITFTRGVVSGFTQDASIRGRAWIKTDTTIAGGNSGGTAVDENGRLVGVPTEMGAGDAESYVDCRNLVDTNHDGRTDENDTCVPGGGFINALRPVSLAAPLIQAAQQGLTYQGRGSQPTNAPATGQPRLYNLQFSTGVTESDQPSSLITSLPSGSRSLYLFFDYENMVDGTPWELRVQFNGEDMPDAGFASTPWGGGSAGNWWVGWSDAEFQDGTYRMGLVVDGREVADTEIQVGGRTQRTPSFANIVFSQEKTAQDEPVNPGRLFPSDATRLYAFFEYANMAPGTEWTRTWYLNDEVAATTTAPWNEGASGRTMMELTSDDGLPAGNWRLELSIQDKPAARADFTVTGQGSDGPVFQPFVWSDDVNHDTGKPNTVGTSFPAGSRAIYVFSDYQGMTDGLRAISRVFLNGQMVIESPFEWSNEFYGGASGTWFNAIHANGGTLPDGEYTQELEVAGQVVQRGSAVVGSGAGPAPTPAPTQPADGVQIQGVISDADTGRPIGGAFFAVLKPGIKVDAFQWTDDEVYTLAEADRQGAYRLPALLERDQCYSIIIGAEGYWPHTEDDVCIGPKVPEQVDLPIQLQKR